MRLPTGKDENHTKMSPTWNHRSDDHQGEEEETGKGNLSGRTESAKGGTIRPMKLMLRITINIEPELAYGCSCAGGPRWIASAVSEPGHSADVWRANRDVIDMNSARY